MSDGRRGGRSGWSLPWVAAACASFWVLGRITAPPSHNTPTPRTLLREASAPRSLPRPPPSPPSPRSHLVPDCSVPGAEKELATTTTLWGGATFNADTHGRADVAPNNSYILTLGRVVASLGVPPPLVVNVGANKGQFGLHVLAALPTAIVNSLEPFPGTYAILSSTREQAPPEMRARWTVHNLGAGDTAKVAVMYGKPGDEGAHAGNGDGGNHMIVDGFVQESATFVKIGPWLDEKFGSGALPRGRVTLLQVDCEGHDGAVLAGLDWAAHAPVIDAVAFETGAAWLWEDTHNPGKYKLADVLAQGEALGYACFFAGERDLWRVSPSFAKIGGAIATNLHSPDRMQVGTNVLCLRRDSPVFVPMLAAHSQEVEHCEVGG